MSMHGDIFFMDGWGNVSVQLPNYMPGSCDIFKREKSDDFDECSTVYNDRMEQWNFDKYREACKKADVQPGLFHSSLEQLDELLTTYNGYPCRVYFVEVQRGYNGYDVVRMDDQFSSTSKQKG